MPPLSTPTQTPLAPKPTKPPPPYPPLPPPPAAMAAAAAAAAAAAEEEELPLRRSKHQLLGPRRRRTNPLVWCFAVLCFLFSLLVIFVGILILVVFLLIKPRNPQFDASAASLNGIYIDSAPTIAPTAPGDYFYLNGDLTLLANISNPNRHIDVAFRYLSVELYFRDRLIAAQGLAPFAQRRGEARVASLRMVTSEVGLPRELAAAMAAEVRSGRVSYTVRGTFKVRASLGFGHLTYWVYGRCDLELSPPPSGVLLARRCSTKY